MDNWFVSWKGSIRWLPVRILGFLVAHTGDIQVEWESARIYSAKRQKSNWQFDLLIDIFFWYAIAVNWTFSSLHRKWNPMSNWLNRFVSHLQLCNGVLWCFGLVFHSQFKTFTGFYIWKFVLYLCQEIQTLKHIHQSAEPNRSKKDQTGLKTSRHCPEKKTWFLKLEEFDSFSIIHCDDLCFAISLQGL